MESLQLSHWAAGVGMVGITANFLLQPELLAHPGILLATALNILCLCAAPRYPLPTWCGYLLLFLFLSIQPDIRMTVFTFFAPLMAALIVYRGHDKATIIGGLILWYLGSIDPVTGNYFPPDILASVIWGGIIAISILVGYAFYRITRDRTDMLMQWDEDVRNRKESLIRTLHDSVATSLTSVIMRSEALSVRHTTEPEIHAELTAIADQARTSMQEIRSLLDVLHQDTGSRKSESELPVSQQLVTLAKFIKDHGFTVALTDTRLHMPLNADSLVALQEILGEIATNIIKYAKPRSVVSITVNDNEDMVIIRIENSLHNFETKLHLSSGMGLPAISQLAATLGGAVNTISNSTNWTTELRIPK